MSKKEGNYNVIITGLVEYELYMIQLREMNYLPAYM